MSHLPLARSEQTRKPEPMRPGLRTPPKRLGALPRRVHIRGVPIGAPKKDRAVRNCKGAIRQTDPSQPTIPECVAESRTRVAQSISLLSTSILQGRPAKRQAAEIPVR